MWNSEVWPLASVWDNFSAPHGLDRVLCCRCFALQLPLLFGHASCLPPQVLILRALLIHFLHTNLPFSICFPGSLTCDREVYTWLPIVSQLSGGRRPGVYLLGWGLFFLFSVLTTVLVLVFPLCHRFGFSLVQFLQRINLLVGYEMACCLEA